jgi:hypothetical protein
MQRINNERNAERPSFFHTSWRVKADAIRIATPWRRITESIIRLSRDREGGYNPYNHMLGGFMKVKIQK